MAKISKNKVYDDPIRTCKENPTGFTYAAVSCDYYTTPEGRSDPNRLTKGDGGNVRGWRPMDSVTASHTFTDKR